MKVLARIIEKYISISEVYPMEKDQTVQDSTGNSLQVEKYLLYSGPQIFILWGTESLLQCKN